MRLVASQSVPHGEPCWSSSRTLGSQVWRSTRRQVQYSYVAQGQPLCWARCPCVVIPLGDPTCVFFHGTAPPPWWVRVFPGRTLCLLCCVAISPQAGWVYLRDSRMWYCPWPVHTCNLHMIPPYAGCGSVAFPPTWGTLSQCYSTHWAEQQCGYLCLNPVLSSIPTGVGGLAGFCRALEGVSNSGVFQGISLVSQSLWRYVERDWLIGNVSVTCVTPVPWRRERRRFFSPCFRVNCQSLFSLV